MKFRFCRTKFSEGLSLDDLRALKSETTPGPWEARDYPNADGGYWVDCVAPRGPESNYYAGGTLATASKDGCGKGRSPEKNAQLIAAAPELLTVLLEVVDQRKALIESLDCMRADYAVEVDDIERGVVDDDEELAIKRAKRDAFAECLRHVRSAFEVLE